MIIQDGARAEIDLLKELTAHYVIRNPALVTIQHGQRRVVRQLFKALYEDASTGAAELLPIGARELLSEELRGLTEKATLDSSRARIVADVICALTEQQALKLHGRLMGHDPGSLLEPLP